MSDECLPPLRFKSMDLAVPASADDLASLAAGVDPLHRRAAQAVKESIELAALRDALLPELLSGSLRVPVAKASSQQRPDS